MAEDALGVGFDVHGGGSDLLFPHHENEAAQTRAARGAQLAKIWMHNGMIQSTGEKMAKSVGNIAPLHEVLDEAGEGWGRHAVVMYLIGGHYRQPLAFSRAELEDAERRVNRIRDALRRLVAGAESPPDMAVYREAFSDALAEDFNTPKALASLFEWVREANRRELGVGEDDLRAMLEVLGLVNLFDGPRSAPSAEVVALAEERERARAEGDFARADELRAEIAQAGWTVRDSASGFELLPADE